MSSKSEQNLPQGRSPDSAALRRMRLLFDGGEFTEFDAYKTGCGGLAEVVTGYGPVLGLPVFAFSQDRDQGAGAMGQAQAAKIAKIYELAKKTGAPVVGIFDSAGGHLREGLDALSAYGELTLLSGQLSGVVPQISLILGDCGGSSAVFAAQSDIVILSDEANFFLTPPSLVGGETGNAENAAKNGSAHLTAPDETAAVTAAKNILALLPENNLSAARVFEYNPPAVTPESDGAAPGKASAELITASVADGNSLIELSKDYAQDLRTFLCTVNGISCGIVATERKAVPDRITSAGAKKGARFVRFCDSFSIPVITLVDTLGFAADQPSEEAGILREAAALSHAYAEATTPKIAVITGNAVGPAFTALAGRSAAADVIFAWHSAYISPLLPETAASILWSDRISAGESRSALSEEYKRTLGSAGNAASGGHIDNIIEPSQTREVIADSLEMLLSKRISTLPKKHSNIPF